MNPCNAHTVRTRKRDPKITYFCARLGDGTEVVDHVGFGHADTSVTDDKELALLVWDDPDVEFLFMFERRGIGERLVADFVEGIRAVRDQFSEEDLFVGVESV
jgi:hypothetical protein